MEPVRPTQEVRGVAVTGNGSCLAGVGERSPALKREIREKAGRGGNVGLVAVGQWFFPPSDRGQKMPHLPAFISRMATEPGQIVGPVGRLFHFRAESLGVRLGPDNGRLGREEVPVEVRAEFDPLSSASTTQPPPRSRAGVAGAGKGLRPVLFRSMRQVPCNISHCLARAPNSWVHSCRIAASASQLHRRRESLCRDVCPCRVFLEVTELEFQPEE